MTADSDYQTACGPLQQGGDISVRAKIRPISELAAISAAAKAEGRVVVMAHGAFDLLHMGHVRHLEQARKQGDLLIVTITGDSFINKGPGRPVFTSALRAEMLAALAYVDWVGVNEQSSAEGLITALKPNVYVKGSDYLSASDDITGKIVDERAAVEAGGGRIHFTDDITFSSSSLLNRHFDVFDPALRNYLDTMRGPDTLAQLFKIIENVSEMRVLLVGDTIIDEYQYVQPLGKSPKENLIPTLYRDSEIFAGGVIAAANHVAGFCRDVQVLTCLGSTDDHEQLVRNSLLPNVKLNRVMRTGVPTTRKTRFIDPAYFRKMFEVYFMDDSLLSGESEAAMLAEIDRLAPDFDLVIVTDFGHGMISPTIGKRLQERSKFIAINAQSNSANTGFNLITKYSHADYVCIDAPEARLAVADKYSDIEVIAGETLPGRVTCDRLIITHGRHGCVTYDRQDGVKRIPAFTGQALDTMGAGDAFLAVTAPLVASGAPMELVGFIGNAVGAMKVGIVGHRRSVEKVTLLKYLTTLMK